MIDRGQGTPIVLIPGIQGRWEWMTPAIRALAQRHRVLSFSLGEGHDAPGPEGVFDAWVKDIDLLLDRARLTEATIAGVSFGGLIAVYYASRRPERVSSLALVSTPAPIVRLNDNADFYLNYPRVALPVFAVRAAMRLLPEAMSARLKWGSRIQFLAEHGARVVASPLSAPKMVRWVRAWQQTDITRAARRVTAPTLIVTGEQALDKVVPVSSTLEYLDLIPGSRYEVLQRTGHVGLVSRPADFAKVIGAFADAHGARAAVAAPAVRRAAGQAG